jgi:hypothetical protein
MVRSLRSGLLGPGRAIIDPMNSVVISRANVGKPFLWVALVHFG